MRLREVIALVGLCSVCSPALALDLDYYTYNGFDATVAAFERIALIFGSTDYLNLAFVFVVLGIFAGAFVFAGKSFLQAGSQGNPLSWFFIVMLGVAVFRALIIPTGTVHVYDPVRNAYQGVGDVPDLVILVAGGTNKIERAVVELLDASAPHPYQDVAGGISFQLLLNAMTDYSGGIDDQYLVKSLKQYYSDCSQMALIQASYDFDLNQLRSGTDDFMDLLPKLKSPADYTVVYDATPAGKGGTTVTCEQAWDSVLQPAFADNALYSAMMRSVCAKSGFDPTSAAQLARCQGLLAGINADVFDFVATPEHFLRQSAMANAIASAIQDDNPDLGLRALSNRAIMVEGIGVAQAANEWLPTIRSVVLAIVLGVFPLLVIFLVTPLFARAVAAIVGLFAWITLWGIADALVHHQAMDQALAAMLEVQRHNMGLTAMLQSPEASMQALAIFGKARGMGITIASLLSVMIFRLSAAGLAGVTASWQARVDGAGASAATRTQTPEGVGGTLESLKGGISSAATASMMGFGRMATAASFSQQTEARSQSQLYEGLAGGGSSLAQSTQALAAIEAGARIGNVAATAANVRSKDGDPTNPAHLQMAAAEVARTGQLSRFGDADAQRQVATAMGFEDVQQMSAQVSYLQSLSAGTDTRTHGANAQRFQEAYEQFTGESLSRADAYQMYSQMRMADVTGRINAFGADTDAATGFFATSQALQQHQLDGLIAGADRLGVSPTELAAAQGVLTAARQSGDADALAALSPRAIALGSFVNATMSTTSAMETHAHLNDRGYMDGIQQMMAIETESRIASADVVTNLAALTGIPMPELVRQTAGANVQLAVTGDQVRALPGELVRSEDQFLATDGGLLSVSLNSAGEPVDNVQLRSGQQALSDDSSFANAGFAMSAEAAGSIVGGGELDRISALLRRTDGDTQSTLAIQKANADYLSQISQSNVSISDQKGAGGSVATSGTLSTPFSAITGTGVSVTAEGHVRYDATATDTDTFDANLRRVQQVWERADAAAQSSTDAWLAAQSDAGVNVSPDQRQDRYFDEKAVAIHTGISTLVNEDLERLTSATENPIIGAERVKPEPSPPPDPDLEEAIRRSRDPRTMGAMK